MTDKAAPLKESQPFLDFLKHAHWLTPERVRLWATAFSFAWLLLLIFDVLTHRTLGITDAQGEHIGRDFINYWSGAKEALEGHAPAVYDLQGFHDYQVTFAGPKSEMKMYSYPPALLLLTLPLGLLPFLPAFFLWSVLGVAAATLLVRAQTGWQWTLAFIAAFSAPASLWNLIAGQNGFFTAVFLAGGLLLLEKRPLQSGILLGLLCYKPQLGLLIPVALLAGGHWRCFTAAAATVLALVAASTLAFGAESWVGFFHQTAVQRAILEMVPWFRMPTVFSGLRVFGVPADIAYGAQTLSALLAAAVVAMIWRRRETPFGVKAAALCIATFLATPYAWDYDMIVLTCAVIWLAQDGMRRGFQPWEKITWLAIILLPTPLMGMAQLMGFQPGPFVLWFALALVWRRSRSD